MTPTYRRFTGLAALGAALFGFLYSLAFVVVARSDAALGATLAGLFLLLAGLTTIAVFAGLYRELRPADSGFAFLAVMLGTVAMAGAAAHGAYDLANGINPPGGAASTLPSQVDPRGLMTFGVAGLAVLIFSWLIRRSPISPTIGLVGFASALLLEVLFIGRLVILDATSPVIVVAALLAGFVVSPLWYAWLGVHFLRH